MSDAISVRPPRSEGRWSWVLASVLGPAPITSVQGAMKVEIQPGKTSAVATSPVTTGRSGWIDFAGIMTMVVGGLNGIDGLVAFYRTTYFRTDFLIGNLRFWSVLLMAFGVVQFLAGLAILSRQGWGRWFGIITVIISAFTQLLVFGAYPFWSAIILLYDIAVFYVLSVHWQRRVTAA